MLPNLIRYLIFIPPQQRHYAFTVSRFLSVVPSSVQ